MDYHLHRNGQNLGTFPLEDLRRRRISGELTGVEFVWRDGLADWMPIDSVLAGESSPATRPPPLPPAVRRNPDHQTNWGVILAAVLGAIILVGGGIAGVKFIRTVRRTMQAASAGNAPDVIDAAGKSIKAGTNSLTEDVVRERRRQFRIRQYVEGYRKYGQHTAAWDADASLLLQAWVAANYGGGPSNLPSPQVLGDKLAALQDCEDPLVLTAAAVNSIEKHEAIRRLQRALAAFPRFEYKAYPKFFATVLLATDLGGRSQRIRALDRDALAHFDKALSDGSFEPGDEEELAEILVNGWGHAFMERNGLAVCQTARQAKRYQWLALVLEGDYQITEAWKARGNGYADSVTTQGWQKFAEDIAKARETLTEAWQRHPDRPVAPSRMITVAMADGSAIDMREWFDRAMAAQIDYPEAWAHMRYGLRPRWNGSVEAMLALGCAAVDTKRFDTDVPRKFFDCISDVESELGVQPGEHIYDRPDVWPHLQKMYEGYLAEPSQASWRNGWHSTYSAIAYLAGKYDVAREQLEAVDWKPVRHNLTGWGTDLSLMPLQVAALTGKSGSQVRQAESSYAERDLETPIRIYSALTDAPDTDQRTRDFCRSRLAALQQETLLAKGQWVDFLPADDKDPNWEIGDDHIHRLPDGGLEVEAGPQGHGFYSHTRVGSEFEVTGECEFVRSSTEDFQAGLILGLPDAMNSDWYGFRIKRNATEGQLVSFSRNWSSRQVLVRTVIAPKRNTFRFRLQNGKADAWINDTQVMDLVAPEKLHVDSRGLLGLGAYNDMNDTVVRYRNVRVRRLSRDR